MKFTMAWANVLKENLNLRLAVLALAFTTVSLGIITVRLALVQPLLIERGCHTSVLPISDSGRTETEITAFVKSALASRFDTDSADARTLLSDQEFHNRIAEQQELQKKDIRQRVLVNSITVKGETVTVDCDRIISVGKIRSALPFPVQATVATQSRSEANPYGLLLTNVVAVQQKEGEQ